MNNPQDKSKKNRKDFLVATNLYKEYGDRVILSNVSIVINPGEKIGLIGKNGSGKTTLLKILSGQEMPSSGKLSKANLKIGYLPQSIVFKENERVYGVATRGIQEQLNALETLEQMSYNYQANNPVFLEEYIKIQEYLDLFNVFTMRDTIEQTLSELNLSHLRDAFASTLSGGEAVRLNLAQILISNVDILLLDEPTNHLDLHANLWLRDFLINWDGGVLIVSHDRDFLDEVCLSTFEISQGNVRTFGGNYSFYKLQKGIEAEAREREVIRLTKEVKKTKRKVQNEQQRAAHSARRDLSKNPEDHDRFRAHFFKERATRTAGKKKKQADDKVEKAEEKLIEAKQTVQDVVRFPLQPSESAHRKQLIETLNLSFGYGGKKLLENINFQVFFGDRIALFGNNGTGKTTLIKSLLERNDLSQSGVIKKRDDIKIQVLDQNYGIVNGKRSILENVQESASKVSLPEIRQHLAKFLFRDNSDVNRLPSSLSGGETARLAIAMITVLPIDLLILDEPTNNLDVSSIEELESTLSEFKGAILIISHDLSFLRNIKVTKSFAISENRLLPLLSNPTDDVFKSELLRYI